MLYMVNWLKNFFHSLSHRWGLNTGRVVTWHEDNNIYVGFQCDGCGKIDDKTIDKIGVEQIFESESKNEQ